MVVKSTDDSPRQTSTQSVLISSDLEITTESTEGTSKEINREKTTKYGTESASLDPTVETTNQISSDTTESVSAYMTTGMSKDYTKSVSELTSIEGTTGSTDHVYEYTSTKDTAEHTDDVDGEISTNPTVESTEYFDNISTEEPVAEHTQSALEQTGLEPTDTVEHVSKLSSTEHSTKVVSTESGTKSHTESSVGLLTEIFFTSTSQDSTDMTADTDASTPTSGLSAHVTSDSEDSTVTQVTGETNTQNIFSNNRANTTELTTENISENPLDVTTHQIEPERNNVTMSDSVIQEMYTSQSPELTSSTPQARLPSDDPSRPEVTSMEYSSKDLTSQEIPSPSQTDTRTDIDPTVETPDNILTNVTDTMVTSYDPSSKDTSADPSIFPGVGRYHSIQTVNSLQDALEN